MTYGEAKVYSDGAHYVAIPHSTNPTRRRPTPPEEQIDVKIKSETIAVEKTSEDEHAVESGISDKIETSSENALEDKIRALRFRRDKKQSRYRRRSSVFVEIHREKRRKDSI